MKRLILDVDVISRIVKIISEDVNNKYRGRKSMHFFGA